MLDVLLHGRQLAQEHAKIDGAHLESRRAWDAQKLDVSSVHSRGKLVLPPRFGRELLGDCASWTGAVKVDGRVFLGKVDVTHTYLSPTDIELDGDRFMVRVAGTRVQIGKLDGQRIVRNDGRHVGEFDERGRLGDEGGFTGSRSTWFGASDQTWGERQQEIDAREEERGRAEALMAEPSTERYEAGEVVDGAIGEDIAAAVRGDEE